VALVSGLNVGSKSSNQLSVQLMSDFLTGQLGSFEDQQEAAQVGHVIFVGNNLSDEIEVKDPQKSQKFRGKSDQYVASTEFLHQLDDIFFELSTHMTVDVMPGEKDPSNYTLPQNPLFRGMFPRSATLGSFTTISNPQSFQVEGTRYAFVFFSFDLSCNHVFLLILFLFSLFSLSRGEKPASWAPQVRPLMTFIATPRKMTSCP